VQVDIVVSKIDRVATRGDTSGAMEMGPVLDAPFTVGFGRNGLCLSRLGNVAIPVVLVCYGGVSASLRRSNPCYVWRG
jgi:hypothetical protein